MLCLGINTKLPELLVDVLHEGCHTVRNGTEIVIGKLLTLRCRNAKQCTAGQLEIKTLLKVFTVNQEIFLLKTNRRLAVLDFLVTKDINKSCCGIRNCLD